MSAISKIFSKASKAKDFYWAVVIEPAWIQAGVWAIADGKAELISQSPQAAWSSFEDFVDAVDTAMSAAIQDLPSDLTVEPQKTVFGVTEQWVENGEIRPQYLGELKRVCTKLGVTPSGFVVLSEAIAHLIKSKEGAPLTGAVLRFSKDDIGLSIFTAGKVAGSTEIARSVSVGDDVVEGLARFADGRFAPTRLLLYDGKEGDLEEARQALMAVDWAGQKELNLLHPPKVDIIKPEEKILAVTLAGASELADINMVFTPDEQPAKPQESDNLGFVVGEDVSDNLDMPTQQEQAPPANAFQPRAVLGGVAAGLGKLTSLAKGAGSRFAARKRVDEGAALERQIGEPALKSTPVAARMSPLTGMLKRIDFSFSKNTWTVGLVVFGLLVLAGFGYWWFYPKAEVTVYVSPKRLEENMTVLLDTSAGSVDKEKLVVPATQITTTISGDKTKSATGGKTVGERAKGEATIYRVGSAVSLNSGTLLTGPGGLKFTLDSDYTVASGSASTPGETKVNMTAADIGAEYNLASGASFSVGNFSSVDIEAKNDIAFTGGSSRDVSAVSQDDIDTLEEQLTKELLTKANDSLTGELGPDDLLVDGVTTSTAIQKDFSNKEGDETDSVKLDLELKVIGYKVKKADLVGLVTESLASKVPDGFILRDDQVNLSFALSPDADDTLLVDTRVVANLLPDVNPDEVADKILGKYPQLADGFLNSIPGFVRAEIKLKPKLPGKLGTLPRVKSHIAVTIAAER